MWSNSDQTSEHHCLFSIRVTLTVTSRQRIGPGRAARVKRGIANLSSSDEGGVTLRSIAVSAFLPPALFSIGQGAIAPVIVISATQLGADAATAALIAGLTGIGLLVANIPAGALAARVGDRTAMVWASVVICLSLAACMWSPNLLVFAAAMFFTGAGFAVWALARQAYLAQVIPFPLRARAMSTLGGVFRIGQFIGPFIGGLAVELTGLAGAYAVHLVLCVLALAVLLLADDVSTPLVIMPAKPEGTWSLAVSHRRVFATIGIGMLLANAIRATRQVVIPLWGQHLGLSASAIAVIFGLSGLVDVLMFYPAGKAMDRFGRAAGAIPSMLLLAAGHVLVPFTESAGALLWVSLLLGLGNGASSGLVGTLGADLAPVHARARFLGIWRLFTDAGAGAGPLALSGVTAALSLGVGIASFGVVGVGTAAFLWYWIPRRGRPVST
jgi:MFS family permease